MVENFRYLSLFSSLLSWYVSRSQFITGEIAGKSDPATPPSFDNYLANVQNDCCKLVITKTTIDTKRASIINQIDTAMIIP
jgi:hypothetical protein